MVPVSFPVDTIELAKQQHVRNIRHDKITIENICRTEPNIQPKKLNPASAIPHRRYGFHNNKPAVVICNIPMNR